MRRDIRYNKEEDLFDEYGTNKLKGMYMCSIDISMETLIELEEGGIIKILKK